MNHGPHNRVQKNALNPRLLREILNAFTDPSQTRAQVYDLVEDLGYHVSIVNDTIEVRTAPENEELHALLFIKDGKLLAEQNGHIEIQDLEAFLDDPWAS